MHRHQPSIAAWFYCEWPGLEALLRGYLVPLVALVPRLEDQPAVPVPTLVQALQLLHVDALVQSVFHASLGGLVLPRTAAAVSVSMTVSWHLIFLKHRCWCWFQSRTFDSTTTLREVQVCGGSVTSVWSCTWNVCFLLWPLQNKTWVRGKENRFNVFFLLLYYS